MTDIFSSLQPPVNIAVLNETNLGMECTCLPSCSEKVCMIIMKYDVGKILSMVLMLPLAL